MQFFGETIPTQFEVQSGTVQGRPDSTSTLLSFAAQGMKSSCPKKYLTPQEIMDQGVRRPQVVGSNNLGYNTQVYLVGNYTYDTLPIHNSN